MFGASHNGRSSTKAFHYQLIEAVSTVYVHRDFTGIKYIMLEYVSGYERLVHAGVLVCLQRRENLI